MVNTTMLAKPLSVENLQKVPDSQESRWTAEVLLPGCREKTPILLIYLHGRWNACERYCPHEKACLANAIITAQGLLQCPRHHNCYPLNSLAGYVVYVQLNEVGEFTIHYYEYADLASRFLSINQELEALRAANQLQENQIIQNLSQMDGMLKEVEQSKSDLQINYNQSESMAILFARLMDSVSEILLVLDKQGVIQRCNRQAEQQLECHKSELIGINPDTLLATESRQVLNNWIKPRAHGSKSLIYEGVNQKSDFEIEVKFAFSASENWQISKPPSIYLLHGSMLYSGNGMEDGCVLVASNISQVKRREKQLREQQLIDKARLLQVTMDNVSHGMAVFNQQEQLQVWNHAFFQILEYPQNLKQKGTQFEQLQQYDQQRGETIYASRVQSLLVLQTSNRFEYQMQNGCCIEFIINKLPDKGRVISVQDVTDQKQAEATIRQNNEFLEHRVSERTLEIEKAYIALEDSLKELQNTQQQLVQSEKLASMGQLVAGIAHEMNTPVGICLTTVTFLAENTQEIKKRYRDETLTMRKFDDYLESCQSSLDFTVKNLQRAAKLITSFKQLAIDRYHEIEQDFVLIQHIKNIIDTLDPHFMICRPHIQVQGSDNLHIRSYPNIWERIITSLVMNSIRHAFVDMPLGQGQIAIDIRQQSGKLQFSFTDNGCGMDEMQSKKIFDPFYTTSRGRGDIGLGMHIVFNMVNQILNGSISCESKQGIGTRFFIHMPLKS